MAVNTPTLTSAMLNDLHKGNAAISLLAYADTGVTWGTTTATDFENADQIFTLEGTLNITQATPETTDIKIDQKQAVIDVDVNKGDYTITGSVPSTATAILDKFFEVYANDGTPVELKVKGQSGKAYTGHGYFDTPKTVDLTALIESESEDTAVGYARLRFTFVFVQDSMDSPAHLDFTAKVMKNGADGQPDWIVVKADAAA